MQQVNPGSNVLCNEVLRTALRVLTSLPLLSLSNLSKIPGDVGHMTLNQVTDFLGQSMNPNNIGNDAEGSRLASEVLLLLAIQRGQLSLILQWILSAIKVCGDNSDRGLEISSEVVRLAIHQIRSVTGMTILEKTSPKNVEFGNFRHWSQFHHGGDSGCSHAIAVGSKSYPWRGCRAFDQPLFPSVQRDPEFRGQSQRRLHVGLELVPSIGRRKSGENSCSEEDSCVSGKPKKVLMTF